MSHRRSQRRTVLVLLFPLATALRFVIPRDPHLPRITAIPIDEGRQVLRKWTTASVLDGDDDRRSELQAGLQLYRKLSHGDEHIGVLALWYAETVHAMALLEHIPTETDDLVLIWDLHADDRTSGTALLQALQHAMPSITLAQSAHPRWRIASTFMKR